MSKGIKVTKQSTAVAVTKSLSRRSDDRNLRLTEGQRKTILAKQQASKK